MKNKPSAIFILLLCIVFINSTSIRAQDVIFTENQDVWMGIEVSCLGQDTVLNKESMTLLPGNSIKLKALYPHGTLNLSIELGLKNFNSIEFETSLMNVSGNSGQNFVGLGQKIGFKLIIRGKDLPTRNTSSLSGLYIKPEIEGGVLIQRKSYTDTNKNYGMASFFMLAGYQWVLGNIFVIDLYAGPGIPAIFHANVDHYNTAKILGHYSVDKNVPYALSAGMKLGVHFF